MEKKDKKTSRKKKYHVEITVEFVPFPSEEARLEAYRTQARLFLRAKERRLRKEMLKDRIERKDNS